VPPPAANFSWLAEQQVSAGSSQQGTLVLPPGAYDMAAMTAAVPTPTTGPIQRGELPLHAYASIGSSSAAAAPGEMQWATAYQSAAVRQVDMQLVAAGLAAAGRLGLLPSAPCQPSPTNQAAWHAHSAHGMQGGAQRAFSMPDLPSEAQLLSMMADRPNE
jgi:hypothetical protein